ncbi:hypothetical protein LXH13_31075 [Streptomyces spinosirectus]|jgi:hypothetical protein|uniref:hypothetical protein n=1 Tax=Streptomyces spinosirectus TaxID=2906474 RepID=UPI001F3842C9|nr:hypothetical protein [Streptomyces spinosirectus]MBY8340642.1 hypothetical protein [Streptomyces plumbidurans]UIR21221.1 hypothetical protein LXH13_31075 [Streptomyces spinosirectus]
MLAPLSARQSCRTLNDQAFGHGCADSGRVTDSVGTPVRASSGPPYTKGLPYDAPDVPLKGLFGCTAAFPQLAKLAGIRWWKGS